jgi:hypothetical protein
MCHGDMTIIDEYLGSVKHPGLAHFLRRLNELAKMLGDNWSALKVDAYAVDVHVGVVRSGPAEGPVIQRLLELRAPVLKIESVLSHAATQLAGLRAVAAAFAFDFTTLRVRDGYCIEGERRFAICNEVGCELRENGAR